MSGWFGARYARALVPVPGWRQRLTRQLVDALAVRARELRAERSAR